MKYLITLVYYIAVGCLFHWAMLGPEFVGIPSVAIIGGWPLIVLAVVLAFGAFISILMLIGFVFITSGIWMYEKITGR